MKKLKITCCSANEDEDYTREENVIMQTDYDMENKYKVADYDPDSIRTSNLIFSILPMLQTDTS